MKFATTTATVLVSKSSIDFRFDYHVTAARLKHHAHMLVTIECEQGFGEDLKYTGRIAIFANASSADGWLHYTMPSYAAADLSVAVNLQQSPASIGHKILLHAPSFTHRDSGNAIGDRDDMIESAVWAAFTNEVDGLPFSNTLPLTGRAV